MKRKLFRILSSAILTMTSLSDITAQVNEWRYFGPDNTGIGAEMHAVITEDKEGTIFGTGYHVFYQRGSVYRYKNGVYTNWGTKDGYLSDERVNDILFSDKNEMWVATDSGVVMYNGLKWSYYSTANSGLMYNQIISLAKDPKTKHIWATTRQFGQPTNTAVSVFDGLTWKSYSSATIGMLPLTIIGNIQVDANGNKWIAYNRGLIKYNGTSWTILDKTNSPLSDYEVMSVQVDANNKLWCVAGNGSQKGTGIDIYDVNTNAWSKLTGFPVTNASPEHVYVRGNKLLVVEAGSLGRTFIKDGSNWSVLPNTNGDQAFGAFIDSSGHYWIPGRGFIKEFDGTNWKRYTQQSSGLAEYNSNDIFVDSKNRKWFANGNGGIQIWDCPKWEVLGPKNEGHWPTPQNQTPIGTCVTEDKSNGDIWMTYSGTNGFAVRIPNGNTTNSSTWTTYSNSSIGTNTNQLTFSFIEKARANNHGQVGFINAASSGGHVFIFDRLTNTWTTFKKTTEGGPIPGTANCISADTSGAFFVGTFQKIIKFQNGTWSVLNPSLQGGPVNFDFVYTIEFDANNMMWVGTSDGIWKYDGSTWTHWTTNNSALTGPQVQSIAFYNNKVYAAAYNVTTIPYNGGISVFDGSNWQALKYGTTPLSHYQIEKIATDTLGNLWISTIAGVNVYRQGGTKGFECLDNDRKSWKTISTSVTNATGSYSGINTLSVYPNPSKEQTTITIELNNDEVVQGTITDLSGRVVKNIPQNQLTRGSHAITIDLRSLQPGIYLCSIQTSGESRVAKIIVQ